MDARQHHHDDGARGCAPTLPLAHRGRYDPLFAGRTTTCSRCGELRLAVPSTGESPAWGKRGFLGKQGLGGSTCLEDRSVDAGERFKTTTPPERSMFARRRCRRNWICNSPVPVCRRSLEKVQWPKGFARTRRKFSPDLSRRKSSPLGLKKIRAQALRSSSGSCSACL